MIILARKGSICLVKYDCGLYGVERQTKATGYGMMYTEDKHCKRGNMLLVKWN